MMTGDIVTGLSSPVSSRSYNSGTVVRCIAMFGVKLVDGMVVHVKINRLYHVPGSIPAVNKWGSGIDPSAPFIDCWDQSLRVLWSIVGSIPEVNNDCSGIRSHNPIFLVLGFN